jgi:hypothetical protein
VIGNDADLLTVHFDGWPRDNAAVCHDCAIRWSLCTSARSKGIEVASSRKRSDKGIILSTGATDTCKGTADKAAVHQREKYYCVSVHWGLI